MTVWHAIWKVNFYVLRYVHVIMLACLYWFGSSDLNNFRSLGFMLLFSFWSMSEMLYRKTVKILIFFCAFFILGQYYFSLGYYGNRKTHDQMNHDLHFM